MRLYVPLSRQEYEALERLAYTERRRPQDQAAAMLAQTLAASLPAAQTSRDPAENNGIPRHESDEAATNAVS
jgi:hypothetical protein